MGSMTHDAVSPTGPVSEASRAGSRGVGFGHGFELLMTWAMVILMAGGYWLASLLAVRLPGFVPAKLVFGVFVCCNTIAAVLAIQGLRWIPTRGRIHEMASYIAGAVCAAALANAVDLALWLLTDMPLKTSAIPNMLFVLAIVLGAAGMLKLAHLSDVGLGSSTLLIYVSVLAVYLGVGHILFPELTGSRAFVTDNAKEVVFGLLYTLLIAFISALAVQIWLDARGRLRRSARLISLGTLLLSFGCELYAAAFLRTSSVAVVMNPLMLVLVIGYMLIGLGNYRAGSLVVEFFDPKTSELPPATALSEIFGESVGLKVYEHLVGRIRESEAALIRTATEAQIKAESIALLESEVSRRLEVEKQLRKALEQAEAAGRAKSDFLAMVSHELRTPLTVMLAYSSILAEGLIDEGEDGMNVREVGARIRRSGENLMGLIEGLLDTSRVEIGRFKSDIRPIHLAEELAQVVEYGRKQALSKGIEFRALVPPADVVVRTDPHGIRQVLVNLLSNACKFTAKGSVELEVVIKGRNLEMTVRDTGIGIPEADLGRVFEPFFQVSHGSTRRFGGAGLGLPICQRIVGMLGGTIEIESQLDIGTVVTLVFPGVVGSEESVNR